MEKDLFKNLPSEIKLEILSRLPIRSVVKYKLVDRSWRNLIESLEFAKSYKPTPPCLADTIRLNAFKYLHKVYEVEDGDENSENSCKEAFNFRFPHLVSPKLTLVNGLLFMTMYRRESYDMYICNPVTREYITVPSLENDDMFNWRIFRLGVSKKSGQFKVVRIFNQWTGEEEGDYMTYWQVHTLGTGLWSSITIAPSSSSLMYTGHHVILSGHFLMETFTCWPMMNTILNGSLASILKPNFLPFSLFLVCIRFLLAYCKS